MAGSADAHGVMLDGHGFQIEPTPMMTQEEILIRLGINADSLKAGMDAATKGIAERLKENFKDIGKDLLAGFTATALMGKIENLFDRVENIKRTASITGTDTEGIQRFDYAAAHAGVEIDTANAALEKLNANIGKAREEGGQAAKAFERWGIDIQGLSNDQIIAKIAEKMQQMPDPASRAALAVELMGRSGKDLIPLLERGADAIKAMGEHAPVFSEEDLENIEQAHNTIQDMNNQVTIWLGKMLSGWSMFWQDLGHLSAGDLGQIADPAKLKDAADELRETLTALRLIQQGGNIWDSGLFGSENLGSGPSSKSVSPDPALDALDKINQKRLELMESLHSKITDQQRRIYEDGVAIAALDEAAPDYVEQKNKLLVDQANAQEKLLDLQKQQNQLNEEASRLALRIQENNEVLNNRGFEAPSTEDLAGRGWSKRFESQYGAGGRFDLGSGKGPFASIARDYVEAKFQQMRDRQLGNIGQADMDRQRMNNAQDALINAGAASPDMKFDKLLQNTQAMQGHLEDLVKNGAVINTKLITDQ